MYTGWTSGFCTDGYGWVCSKFCAVLMGMVGYVPGSAPCWWVCMPGCVYTRVDIWILVGMFCALLMGVVGCVAGSVQY